MNNGICYIICASENIGDVVINKKPEDYIISVDGGFEYLNKLSVSADMVLGDFDSLNRIPEHENVIVHQVEKDETDSYLAVTEGLNAGYKKFVIYGGLGGKRFDHTLANIQLLNMIAKNGARGYLADDDLVMTVIKNSSITFGKNEKGIFSVFCMGDRASGINISNAKYCLNNYSMTNAYPIGISNEFIGENCTVSVDDGMILLIWHGKSFIW